MKQENMKEYVFHSRKTAKQSENKCREPMKLPSLAKEEAVQRFEHEKRTD